MGSSVPSNLRCARYSSQPGGQFSSRISWKPPTWGPQLQRRKNLNPIRCAIKTSDSRRPLSESADRILLSHQILLFISSPRSPSVHPFLPVTGMANDRNFQIIPSPREYFLFLTV